ncbi:MAG: VgrG-related protein, partial [Anaerolineaceae bacterium]|nr:VgrG-related protein [Anaerolineaceae bacterium]
MTLPNELASQISIKLDGSDVQSDVIGNLSSLVVDQHAHLPDMFLLRFFDQNLEMMDSGPFDLTKEVEVVAISTDGTRVTLIKGEITALEPEFKDGMEPEFAVRGYDKTHRLYRENRSKAFLNVKDSDIASEIAEKVGLQTEIETTSTPYDHVFQNNQTDLSFLMQRAWRIGYECFVSDDKLYFRKPQPSGSASVTLKWGEDLKSFQPRMTLAEQVDEVIVRGWDIEKQEAIVGKAQSGGLYPSIDETKDGKTWASSFGSGKQIIVDLPVVSQAEADTLAAARLDEISGAFIDAEGMATRRPDIKAGEKVKLESLGSRFSGTYLVTSATHMYSPEGFETIFRVTGSRSGLLGEQGAKKHVDSWPGVVTAVVTNTDDPKDWGRVKLKYPWMSDDAESDWARVVGIGAGPDAGMYVIPQVDDEVLVSFQHGSFNQPYVLGGLWNGKNKIPPKGAGAGSGEKQLVRTINSVSGHHITFYDDSKKQIEIETADGRSITLSDSESTIVVKTSGVTMTIENTDVKIEGTN